MAGEDPFDNLRRELQSLEEESSRVRRELVVPGWGGPLHGFPRTLYGYVMNCFAFIDVLSQYWSETHGIKGNQTQRMEAFVREWLGYGELAGKVAVQMWRHKLMHTSSPRSLTGSTGRRYTWLLHWGEEHLARDQHMRFQGTAQDRVLNLGLQYLVEDLRRGVASYLREVESSPTKRAAFLKKQREIARPTFEDRH